MKKICYVVTVPLTVRAFLIPQLTRLAQEYDVTLICSYDPDLQQALGSKVHYIPVAIPRGIDIFKTLAAIRNLITVFARERYDLVQYSTPNAALCAAIAAKAAKVPIRNYHLMGLRYLGADGIGRWILKFLEKLTCKLSTHVECVSPSNRSLGIREGLFSQEKSTVILNGSTGGVDLERFDIRQKQAWRANIREALGIDKEDFVFGFVGRITRDKGINEQLSAFSKMSDHCKCLIIGSPEGISSLDRALWASALKDPNIILCPQTDQIEQYYAAMDALVLPSYREGFGTVIIEAGAMGVASIATNIAGPLDVVIHGSTGLLVPPKDPEALYEAMVSIRSQHEAMGQAAYRHVVNHYDGAKLCQAIVQRKEQLLQKQQSLTSP